MPAGEDLLWRVEMACRAAWPAVEEREFGGWQLRFTDDATRRTGSLNPLPGARMPDDALLDVAEYFYGERGHTTFLRLPDFLGLHDEALVRRGYSEEAPTRTLYLPKIEVVDRSGTNIDMTGIEIADRVTPDWLAARVAIAGGSADRLAATLALISAPALFALRREEGRMVSIAYGVIVDGLLVLEAVATDPAARGRGHGRAMLTALMAAASECGARDAALQVVADNAPARALYTRLGFSSDLYGYIYYRQPTG
jgi:N-acetylglutamate synthase